jgi:hypothetical protein
MHHEINMTELTERPTGRFFIAQLGGVLCKKQLQTKPKFIAALAYPPVKPGDKRCQDFIREEGNTAEQITIIHTKR